MPKYTFPTDYKEDIYLLAEERKKNMRFIPIEEQLLYRTRSLNGLFTSSDHIAIYKQTPAEILKSIMDVESPLHFTSVRNIGLIMFLKRVTLKMRPKRVKFAVGMIVTHGDEYTDCSTGVIIGWCRNDFASKFISMDIIICTTVPYKMCSYFSAEQTYYVYIILTKCNKLCFVKEDDITLTKPKWIENKKHISFI